MTFDEEDEAFYVEMEVGERLQRDQELEDAATLKLKRRVRSSYRRRARGRKQQRRAK